MVELFYKTNFAKENIFIPILKLCTEICLLNPGICYDLGSIPSAFKCITSLNVHDTSSWVDANYIFHFTNKERKANLKKQYKKNIFLAILIRFLRCRNSCLFFFFF